MNKNVNLGAKHKIFIGFGFRALECYSVTDKKRTVEVVVTQTSLTYKMGCQEILWKVDQKNNKSDLTNKLKIIYQIWERKKNTA